jgi:hypothetical protein
MGNGRVQPSDGLAQAPYQHHLRKRIPFRSRFTGREMRPMPDLPRLRDQLPEAFEGGVFDDGFVEAHENFLTMTATGPLNSL